MKSLVLLRHSKAALKDRGQLDHDRSLDEKGLKDAPLVGKFLKKESLVPDIILCSTAVRTHLTAAKIIEATDFKGEIEHLPDLYNSDTLAYLETVRTLSDDYESAMVVGHNPILEEFLEILTGNFHSLSTSGLARLSLPILTWNELGFHTKGKVTHEWSPKG